ncbi:MAG: sugar phosphate isomerase/epimerase [Treponema sp.]|nr:sugar phosphate isomerase/epimerase [Treponema sp.]
MLKLEHADTAKLGFVQGWGMASMPKTITDRIEQLKWYIRKTAELGGGVVQFSGMPEDWNDRKLKEVKEVLEETNIAIEIACHVFGGWTILGSLAGENKSEVRALVDAQIKSAHFLGTRIIRSSYGKMCVRYSRYNKSYPLKEHIKYMVDTLKETARICEGEDLYFGLENHADFTGREFAQIYEEVGSKRVGCTLDTANGFTVFSDANDDIEALAPWAITTHIKDIKIEDTDPAQGWVPMIPRGCPIGEGNVNIPRALELLDQQAPFKEELHLVLEQSWMNYDGVKDRAKYDEECLHRGLRYVKSLLGRV